MIRSNFVLQLLAGVALAGVAIPARAQDASGTGADATAPVAVPTGTAAAAAAPTDAGITDIVVTANKQVSSVQKTPIALRVVSGDDIRASGVTDVSALQRLAPDLGITTDTVYTKLSLRGITAESIAEGADAALTVNIDGEYINRPVALNASFFDLDRIEVLKGPQGTLYGRNSTAGAINIITKKPSDKFEGFVTGGYGNYDAWNVQAAVNVPLADGLAVRVAGIHSQHNGYRNNNVDGGTGGRNDDGNLDGGRGTLAYDGGRVHAFVQGEYIDVDQSPPAQYGVPISTTTQGVVALPTTGADGIAGTADDGVDYLPRNTNFSHLPKHAFPTIVRGFFRSKQYHIRGKLDFELSDHLDLTYSGGYLHNNTSSYIPLSGTPNVFTQNSSDNPHNDSRDWSNELRLSYKGDRGLFVQGGVFYFHEKQIVQQSIQIPNPPFGPPGSEAAYVNAFYRPGIYLNSLAAFLQGDVPITDTLKVTGGVRYTRDKKRGTYYNFGGFGFINSAFGLALPTQADIAGAVGTAPGSCAGKTAVINGGTYSVLNQCYGPKGQVNWLAGVEWTPRPGHLFYAKASTGFRSGGFDNLTSQIVNGQQVGTFSPEKITSYEIGAKNRFDGNRIELNLSAFHYDYRDLQIDNFINTIVGAATVNAGKARFNGFESDFTAAITEHDRLTVTANYLDAKLTRFEGFATGINGDTPALDLDGNRTPQAPKVTVAVGYDHSFDLGNAGTLKASAYTRFKSAYYLTSYNNRGDRQEGYSQTDLSLTYTTPDERFSVQGYVHNIENYVPVTYASFVGGSNINVYNLTFGAPRTYGVSGTFKF